MAVKRRLVFHVHEGIALDSVSYLSDVGYRRRSASSETDAAPAMRSEKEWVQGMAVWVRLVCAMRRWREVQVVLFREDVRLRCLNGVRWRNMA